MLAEFSRARSLAIYLFNNRANSNSSSTSRQPRRSASPSQKRCWPLPTRLFNEAPDVHRGARGRRGQRGAMPVIGVLLPQSANDYKIEIAALLQGLKETGFVAGQNVAVEYRYAENQFDRLPALAATFRRPRL